MAMKRPTLVDLAEASGFSVALASIVMRDASGVPAETRQRVKGMTNRVRYQPNWLTQGLRRSNSGLLGVNFAISHPFHADLVRHPYRVSFGKDVGLMLGAYLPRRLEGQAAATLLDKRCETMILPEPTTPAEKVVALARDVPVATVVHHLGGIFDIDVVRSDDHAGVATTVDHLASLGHRWITHVDDNTQAGVSGRRAGYHEIVAGRGLDSEIRVVPGSIEESDGYATTMVLFDSGSAPIGILAFNDKCAAGVLSVAAVLGCHVPEDLSVVGYDDSRRAVTTRAPLTPLTRTYETLAVTTIDRAITQTRERSEALEIVAQSELVIRESTGRTPDSPRGS